MDIYLKAESLYSNEYSFTMEIILKSQTAGKQKYTFDSSINATAATFLTFDITCTV